MRNFITNETREAIHNVARMRTLNKVIETSNQLYKQLEDDLIDAGTYGGDYITSTVERRIGKTCALINLASKYDVPIIVPNNDIKYLVERQAQELDKKVNVITINKRCPSPKYYDLRKSYRVVLTEERVDIDFVKSILRPLGIIGIN